MICKTCHYSLQGLTRSPHQCPECGRAFDPNRASTFTTSFRVRVRRHVLVIAIIVMVYLGLFTVARHWKPADYGTAVLLSILIPLVLLLPVLLWHNLKRK